MKKTTSVDEFIANADTYRNELKILRKLLNSTELSETIKWGAPCYTAHGKNIVSIGAFKSYFGLWFYQGALLEDKNAKLINAQEGKTKALRQWRMTESSDIKPAIIKRYVKEAIANAQSGRKIKVARNNPIVLPLEFSDGLSKNKKAARMFEKLTPGYQREYVEYVQQAKRPETKLRRVAKIIPMIIQGGGLNDKYRA